MSQEDQTKEGYVYAFRRHLSSRGRRRKALPKGANARETTTRQGARRSPLKRGRATTACARGFAESRRRATRAARAARIPSLRTSFGTGSWLLARVVSGLF
ncbi:unnamed protein product [Sphagnum jensenii]|uniref:Uncharacterized protein n=1 Tax=Sphagnum jensenii TaxID=128206 RepID=A0ABP1ASH1_9BRYO